MGQILNQSKETLDIVKCPWMSPFMDVLHFICICVYSSAIYYMTEAFQSLWVKSHFTLTKEKMMVSKSLKYNTKVYFMFFNGMQKYKDVVQIYMDEATDAIVKYHCHQLLEHWGAHYNHPSASLGSWM